MPGRHISLANTVRDQREAPTSEQISSSDSDPPPVVELVLQPSAAVTRVQEGRVSPLPQSITTQGARSDSCNQVHILGPDTSEQQIVTGSSRRHSLLYSQPPNLPDQCIPQHLPPLPAGGTDQENPAHPSLSCQPLSPMLALHRCRLFDWSPTPIVALAASPDGAHVVAARESGQLELWRAAAGAVGWQCESIVPGANGASISSLAWLSDEKGTSRGRLLSGGLNGRITEWDLCSLEAKAHTDSYGGPVWALAAEPIPASPAPAANPAKNRAHTDNDTASSSDESDSDSDDADADVSEGRLEEHRQRMAVACDDGCVRLFAVDDASGELQYARALPRVEGRILSVAWGQRPNQLFSGGSDGCIRAWDVATSRELVRITAGIGGLKKEDELCIWALLSLRDGTLVSGDSSGSTQFWDGEVGTLLQAQKRNQGDVLALASPPRQDVVFAAGIDGQISMYQRTSEAVLTGKVESTGRTAVAASAGERWVHVGGRRSHTHDVRALAIALPRPLSDDAEAQRNQHRKRKKGRSNGGDALALAHGSPMLVSGGNDSLLFTYPANSFLAFHPFCFSPCPQPASFQLAPRSESSDAAGPRLLSQHATWVDVWQVEQGQLAANGGGDVSEDAGDVSRGGGDGGVGNGDVSKEGGDVLKVGGDVSKSGGDVSTGGDDVSGSGESRRAKKRRLEGGASAWAGPGASFSGAKGGSKLRNLEGGAAPQTESKPPTLVARIKKSGAEHIACSAISPDGCHVACSDASALRLFELRSGEGAGVKVARVKLAENVPAAQAIVFSGDSKKLVVAARKGGLWVYDWATETSESVRGSPGSAQQGRTDSHSPVLHMAASHGGKWLAVADSASCVRVYNLPRLKLHWALPPLDGFLPTALSFHPGLKNHLVIATSANRLHVVDVRAKSTVDLTRLGGPSPQQLLEFPGGITGLSVDPTGESLGLVAYGPKALGVINLQAAPPVEETAPEPEAAPSAKRKKKSKRKQGETADVDANGSSDDKSMKEKEKRQFKIVPMKDPCLFVGHLGPNSLFLAEKPWAEVVSRFPPPLYRHKYGT